MKAVNPERLWSNPKAFHQQLRMAAVQVAGLSKEELAMALAYEVEPFSAIPAAEAELAWKDVPDADPAVRVFEVVEIRREKSSGLSLAGGTFKVVCGAMALLLVGAAVDAGLLAHRKKTLSAQVAQQAALDAQLQQLKRQGAAVRDEVRSLRDRRMDEALAQQNVEKLRAAHREMLQALAAALGSKAVLKSMQEGDAAYSVTVNAISLSTSAAAEARVEVTKALTPRGWQVRPGAIAADAKGGTVAFAFELRFDEGGTFK